MGPGSGAGATVGAAGVESVMGFLSTTAGITHRVPPASQRMPPDRRPGRRASADPGPSLGSGGSPGSGRGQAGAGVTKRGVERDAARPAALASTVATWVEVFATDMMYYINMVYILDRKMI